MNDEFLKYVNNFIGVYQLDDSSRYRSFDYIRKAFLSNRKDKTKKEYITLHLYTYLASWGMLRNSFLMQKDYLFNKGIVEILYKSKYDSLINYDPFKSDNDAEIDLIISLVNEIKNYYKGKRYYKETIEPKIIQEVTDTLVSKIILGTFGCTVAYDNYVKKGLKSLHKNQRLNKESINEINNLAREYQTEINISLKKINSLYTPIKIIDMYLFELGKEV